MRFKFLLIISFTMLCCKGQNSNPMTHEFTNALINETSPYLLQHAHNPVNWQAWNSSSLEEAKTKNKLVIISVGYAACHWCHVMEHESFEDLEVAEIMNSNFINIKIDREERPDIDQVYMNAVQLMTGSGGWPLNVIALPDGRPIWGGTYFRKEQWISSLEQISKLYKEKPEKLFEYAQKLEEGIISLDLVNLNTDTPKFEPSFIEDAVYKWSKQFDYREGGLNRSPKFMMPNNYHFLLRYAHMNKDEKLQKYVNTTLTQMAYGGIFDQIGGGFSRYATDINWHVPHFEKMLYDNGQLVSLYADAYLITKDKLYKNVIEETLCFIKKELMHTNGMFYSSLDADSTNSKNELEEGAYYVWGKEDLQSLLADDFKLFSNYYNINNYGYWEHNNYVLIRKDDDLSILKKFNLTQEELNTKKKGWKDILLKERSKRDKPRLDDKTLTSWNAIMLKGYVDAYRVLGNGEYLEIALKNAAFIRDTQLRPDGGLNHNFKNGRSSINGYLEDYANTIDAFLALYENTIDESWLLIARDLSNYVFDHFVNDASRMFYFTSDEDPSLVSRTIEYRDNVIPASNSLMAKNLFKLSHYFNNSHFHNVATTMLNNVKPEILAYPSSYSNWLDLMLNYTQPFYEVAIVGDDVMQKISELNTYYIPNKLIAGSKNDNGLHLLKNRHIENETLIYVCVNNACKIPVSNVKKAIQIME